MFAIIFFNDTIAFFKKILNFHLIDLPRFLVGEIGEVIGLQETFIKERPILKETKKLGRGQKTGKVDVDDTTLFLARFKNGAIGSFEATRFANGRRNG